MTLLCITELTHQQKIFSFFPRIQSSDPSAASKILSRLKANVCNKEERKICCPLKSAEVSEEKTDLEEKPKVEEKPETGSIILSLE